MDADFIIISDGVTEVGKNDIYDYAHGRLEEIKEVLLPDSLTSISDCAFMDCCQLEAIDIPKGLTHIGENAFRGCSKLKRIELPTKMTYIGDAAFMDCESLEMLEIPEGIIEIGKRTFLHCKQLKRIFLPMSLKTIGTYAFAYCEALEELVIPRGVTKIGEYAFRSCENLERIFIDNQKCLRRTSYSSKTQILPSTFPEAILETFKLQYVIDKEFFDLLLDPLTTYLTSNFLVEMGKLSHRSRYVRYVGTGMIVYRDNFLVSYLNGTQYMVAYEAFIRGRRARSTLMDSDYLVVDNSIANCVGIIQEEYISRFSPLKECVPLKSEAKSRRLLYQMRKLAKVSVYVVVNAIWYNEQDDVFRIFDYGKVKIDDNDMKERYDGYLRLLSRWLPWGDNEEERQESKEDGEDY